MKPSGPAMTELSRVPSVAYTSCQAVGGTPGNADADAEGDGPFDGEGAGKEGALGSSNEAGDVAGLALGVDEQAQTNSETYARRASSIGSHWREPWIGCCSTRFTFRLPLSASATVMRRRGSHSASRIDDPMGVI
jgi:hypothetical protein